MWTDAFINYAKVLITKHSLLAGDLFMYMAIIRGDSHHLQLLVQLAHLDFGLALVALVAKLVVPEV
jgi:hypothetical protein